MATLHLPKKGAETASAETPAPSDKAPESPRPTPELNPRNQVMAEIAARAAERHAEDTEELSATYDSEHEPKEKAEPEPVSQEAEQPAEEPSAPSAEAEVQPEPAPEPEPVRMVQVKINGVVREVPETELINFYQKESSAQEKFEQAARMREEALALFRQQQPTQAPAPAPQLTQRELVEKIQYGSADEAAEALQTLQALTLQQARQEIGQVFLKREFDDFAAKNADIWGDDMMRGAMLEAESQLAANDPGGSSRRTWETAAKQVRERFLTQATAPAATAVKAAPSADRQERKASITVVPSAGARVATTEQTKRLTTSEQIEMMRKQRQKGRNF